MAWDNFIEELKLQVNIVDVVSKAVSLKKAGTHYKGLCPFHSEKTPSFIVNEEKQIFVCFGCGEKGDAIKFIQSYYKLPFMEAVEKLASDYGIKMPEKKQSGPKIDYDKYYEINAKAARFFFKQLTSTRNPGLPYFRRRRLTDETITKFGLGYAPRTGSALVEYLKTQNVSDDDMLTLGLALRGKNGLYDKFRDRVIFPIINTQNKVIGFGGRAIEDIKPKYLNSPESVIFLKKNNLFGLNLTRNEISSQDRSIIVEGYMDVISLYQNGITNVAASLGTALTDNQAKLLCRYSKNVILSYDSDNAGVTAALRGIDVISNAGGKPRILSVDDGKDPDEYVHKHGKDAFLDLVNNAASATDFRIRLAKRKYDLNDDRQVLEYIEELVPIFRSLGPVESDIYIRKIAQEFGISEHAIMMAVQSDNSQRKPMKQSGYATSEYRKHNVHTNQGQLSYEDSTQVRIEMTLIILAINNTRYFKRFHEDGISFQTMLASRIESVCMSLMGDTNMPNGTHRIEETSIRDKLDPEEETSFAGFLKSIRIGPDDEAFYQETLSSYLLNKYKRSKQELLDSMIIAEKLGRMDEVDKLTLELMEIDHLINETMEDKNA